MKENKRFTKITEEMYEADDCDIDKIVSTLEDRVYTFWLGTGADHGDMLLASMIDCESPIEQLLALMMAENRLEYMSLYNPAIVDVNIKNQPRITVDGKKYRADFMVSVEYKGKTGAYYVHYLIECDGYEFHQKTKKQVEYDNARTRDLQKCGYIVVRFSGSEIWNHPHNCIMELVSIILSNCNK